MIWSRLKNFKCPKCNRLLLERDHTSVYCSKGHISVSFERFEDMVNLLYKTRKVPVEWLGLISNTS